MFRKFLLGSVLVVTILLVGCQPKSSEESIKVVSWGGQFQHDLMKDWLEPAAHRSNIRISEATWDGDYAALTSKISRDLNAWDLVHVEDYYVNIENKTEIFEPVPQDVFKHIHPRYRNKFAVPILQYGYILTIRADKPSMKDVQQLSWADFWNITKYPGVRGVRDFPIGNIEIALSAIGKDVKTYLYDPNLTRNDLENRIEEAILKFNEFKSSIVWYTTGDQIQRGLESGEMDMCAAWSGRAASAFKNLCNTSIVNNCDKLKIFPSTALISVDWWIIPKNSSNKKSVFKFLETAYNSDMLDTAKSFSAKQGYALPIESVSSNDSVTSYFLNAGSVLNESSICKLDEQFWSKNFSWINKRWQDWRFKK